MNSEEKQLNDEDYAANIHHAQYLDYKNKHNTIESAEVKACPGRVEDWCSRGQHILRTQWKPIITSSCSENIKRGICPRGYK